MAIMSPSDFGNLPVERLQGYVDRFQALADEYRENPEMQSRAESDPVGLLAEKGLNIPPGTEVRMVANTSEVFHMVFPPDPNSALKDEDLVMVAGGKGGQPAAPSTVSTLASSLSSYSCD